MPTYQTLNTHWRLMLKQIILSSIFLVTSSLYAQTLSNGEVSSRDLLTHDINKAESFYTKLFSWTSVNQGKYIQLYKDDKPIANIVYIDSDKQSQWMPQFTHNELLKAKSSVIKNGGSILKEVNDSKDGDDYLLIKDAQGALAILTNNNTKNHSGFPQHNEWLWDELWSFELNASEHFYSDLFTYNLDKLDTGYIVFKKNDKWTAGLLANPFKQSQTQWVSTIRVADPKITSEKALSLGGKILVSVEENKGHRDAALIADPAGAILIVEKYTQEKE